MARIMKGNQNESRQHRQRCFCQIRRTLRRYLSTVGIGIITASIWNPKEAHSTAAAPCTFPTSNQEIQRIVYDTARLIEPFDEDLVTTLLVMAFIESAYQPDAVSPAGAIGVLQVMPTTAQGLGIPPHLLTDPMVNVYTAIQYRRTLRPQPPTRTAFLIAYNGGIQRMLNFLDNKPLPLETATYVARFYHAYEVYCHGR